MRPFYFCTVVWGERFVDYLLEYCVPALLAPGNVPCLSVGDHKFLIATTAKDWKTISEAPVMRALARHIEPILLEIDFPPSGRSSMLHMGVGHKLATDRCFRDRAFGVHITPDLILSDGTVRSMLREAEKGTQVYLCPALRFAEEPLFESLREQGLDIPGIRRRNSGTALALNGRTLVSLAMASMHSETASFEFDAPYFRVMASAAWWRVPEDGGMLIHCLSWCPLLLDYAIVDDHDVSTLDDWTLDGDYVHRNFHKAERIYVCDDSDETMLISWSPLAYNPVPLVVTPLAARWNWFKKVRNGAILRWTVASPAFDDTKRRLFRRPVRWHLKNITEDWTRVEHQAQKTITPTTRLPEIIYGSWRVAVTSHAWQLVKPWLYTFHKRVIPALIGDREVWRRLINRLFNRHEKTRGDI